MTCAARSQTARQRCARAYGGAAARSAACALCASACLLHLRTQLCGCVQRWCERAVGPACCRPASPLRSHALCRAMPAHLLPAHLPPAHLPPAQVPVSLIHEVLRSQPGTADMAARYDAFALRSFVEDNRALVWCTGEAAAALARCLLAASRPSARTRARARPLATRCCAKRAARACCCCAGANCENAVECCIERAPEDPLDVICTGCSTTFCFCCKEEAHRPVRRPAAGAAPRHARVCRCAGAPRSACLSSLSFSFSPSLSLTLSLSHTFTLSHARTPNTLAHTRPPACLAVAAHARAHRAPHAARRATASATRSAATRCAAG